MAKFNGFRQEGRKTGGTYGVRKCAIVVEHCMTSNLKCMSHRGRKNPYFYLKDKTATDEGLRYIPLV